MQTLFTLEEKNKTPTTSCKLSKLNFERNSRM